MKRRTAYTVCASNAHYAPLIFDRRVALRVAKRMTRLGFAGVRVVWV